MYFYVFPCIFIYFIDYIFQFPQVKETRKNYHHQKYKRLDEKKKENLWIRKRNIKSFSFYLYKLKQKPEKTEYKKKLIHKR